MARARNIKPSFFDNDLIAECEPLARLLFIGLWTIADYKGDLEYRPKRIKAEILPYDNCDIEKLLAQLIRYGFLQQFNSGDTQYLRIVNFTKHQNPHKNEIEKGSDIPDCVSESLDTQRITINHDKNGTTHDKNGTNPADSLNLIPDSLILIPTPLDSDFEDFWNAYDYKIDKAPAKKKYIQALKKTTSDVLLKSAIEYQQFCKATNTSRKYVSTWLNQECWENDYTQQQKRVSNANIETEAQRRKRLENVGK
jgi:uncharacterized protein YlbG (UPF0298 family)